MRTKRLATLVSGLTAVAVLAIACGGETFQVTATGVQTAETTNDNPNLSTGGEGSVSVGGPAGTVTRRAGGTAGGDPKCATNSNPEHGFTATTMKWGTIIPLTGALRPLGQQTARVMKTATEVWLNSITKIPGPYDLDWGCSQRPGIYGRRVSLEILSMQANTPEEALAHMRRHITSNKVFLVRDCYLESNLLGPATQFQNQAGVPGIWCAHSELPAPALAKWNFNLGVDPLKVTGVHVGWLLSPGKLNRQRMAIIADPSIKDREVKAAKQIAANFGKPVPDECIVLKPAQEAQNGMESEMNQIRGCYGTRGEPDAVLAMDILNAAFGALEAEDQGWHPAINGVQWSCLTCWVQTIAELCGDACREMLTDCQALPCITWADRTKYPAAGVLKDVWAQYLTSDNQDILTYAPAAITGGLGLWLGMTGPDLSRDKLRVTLENLKNWDAGIGPILTTNPGDHYGGKSVWIMKFTGTQNSPVPYFADVTGRFVPLSEVGVPEGLTQTG